MTVPRIVPHPAEVTREVMIVVGGALLAAFIMSNWPWARQYIRQAWAQPVSNP
jgi:hypothetical protein